MSLLTLKLGIDIDGVLADFTTGYRTRLRDVSGKQGTLEDGEEPSCWFWPTEYGFTKSDDEAAWGQIKSDPTFWYSLSHCFEAPNALDVLNKMQFSGHVVTFLTDRPGVHSHLQTTLWLMERGMRFPQVIVTNRKGAAAQLLGLTHLVDDKPENCFDVKIAQPSCNVFLLRRPYNDKQDYITRAFSLGIPIIPSIRDFFEALIREEHAHALVV